MYEKMIDSNSGQKHSRHFWSQKIMIPKELNGNDITMVAWEQKVKVQIPLMKRFLSTKNISV
jgi:hypothetical protein